jgi:hypothetical protein
VILFEVGDDARAYPLQILTWHEIVNDTVGDVPVVVTLALCATLPSLLSARSMERSSILAPLDGCASAT